MSKDFIAGKRYPRGLTRMRNFQDGKSLSSSYLDLGKLPRQISENEYKKNLEQYKKMANVS